MTDAETSFAEAAALFAAKDAAGAEAALRRVLQRHPNHVPSLNLAALIAGRSGRDAECVALLERAIAHGAGDQAAASGVLLGVAHLRAVRSGEAEAAWRQVLGRAPGHVEATLRLARLLREQGRLAEAVALCRIALERGEDAALLNALGAALKQADALEEAAAVLERAVRLAPDHVEALYNLAAARKDQGRTDEAVALMQEVVARAPDLAAARFALCMAHLPPLYRDQAEIDVRRAAYAAELDRLAAQAERVGWASLAAGVGAAQPFYLAYQGQSDVALQRRYGEIVRRAMAAAFPAAQLADPPRTGERIRVGIVCGHIRDHSVWRLPTRGWVEGLDRGRFEVVGYHTSALRDDETERAQTMFDRFIQGPLSIATWLGQIAADPPHALIYPEIGMDPVVAQLAALRLAPVQYASWGHPCTSGYPTIDAFLSSADMEPTDGDAHYAERLVRLPGLSTTLPPAPRQRPAPTRASLGAPEGATLYWCGQSLQKYLPAHDAVFAQIAARRPDACFVFVEFPGAPALTERFRARMTAALAARGLSAEGRMVFLPRLSAGAFRAAMGCADVVLDSLGWSGCNSLLDAIDRRLPIVTLPGETMRSRHGAAILRGLGLHALVCPSLSAYVDTAVALGADPAARKAIRRALKGARQLLGGAAAIRALEQEIETAVGRRD